MARRLYENVRRTLPVFAWPLSSDFNDISTNAINGSALSGNAGTIPTAGSSTTVTADPYERSTNLQSTDQQYIKANSGGHTSAAGFSFMVLARWQILSNLDSLVNTDGASGPRVDLTAANGLEYYPDKSQADKVTWASQRSSTSVIYCYCVTNDNSAKTASLYTDGILVSTQAIPNSRAIGGAPGLCTIGKETNPIESGDFGYFITWNRVLTDTEIYHVYDAMRKNQYGGWAKMNRLRTYSPAPSMLIPMNAQYGLRDQSGNGRNAVEGNGAMAVGSGGTPNAATANIDPPDTSTPFINSPARQLTSSYVGYVAGQPFSACGLAYRTNSTTGHVLFGSDGGANKVSLKILSGSFDLTFSPDGSVTTTTLTSGWPGTGTWTAWGFSFNPTTDAVRFEQISDPTIGAPVVKTGTNAGNFSSPGNVTIGATASGASDSLQGFMAHFAFWANTHITDFSSILGILMKGMPGRVVESP